MQQILVTGGCGFVGSEFIRQQLAKPDRVTIVNLDKASSSGNLETLAEFSRHPRYTFHRGDITDRECVETLLARYSIDAVVNFACESRENVSLLQSTHLVNTNIVGTQVLLDAARNARVFRFLQVSTDEVHGGLTRTGAITEETPIAPNNPFSASKAAADLLVRAYHQSFGFPAVITRSSDNYGPFQAPEALLPRSITSLMADQPVLVDEAGQNIRDWIHVSDHCRGIDMALLYGRPGCVYLFSERTARSNFEVAHLLLELLRKPSSLIRYSPGRSESGNRNVVDCSKSERELGWQPLISFRQGVQDTIDWYSRHATWVANAQSDSLREDLARNPLNRAPASRAAQGSAEQHHKLSGQNTFVA